MPRAIKRNKYGAIRTTYAGVVYDSKKEAGHAYHLDLLRRSGHVVKVERQVRLPLDVNGHHICTYVADFRVTYPTGVVQLHEVKGIETDVFKLKWKMVAALYPSYELRLIR